MAPAEAVAQQANTWLRQDGFRVIVTLNPEMMVMAQRDPALNGYLQGADLITADGIGVRLAASMLGQPIPAKVTGSDVLDALLASHGYRVYVLGASAETNAKACEKLKQKYPLISVVGGHHGYLNHLDHTQLMTDIAATAPDIVLVGMGSPRQDEFLAALRTCLSRGIGVGIGGLLDVISGEKPRAPLWMQWTGMEWLFRGLIEPSRVSRWNFIPRFFRLVAISYLTQRLESAQPHLNPTD
ncbi:MAG: WecB/TagA/CpsF family glycosyltransferase [Candidatus Margulisiibacteriota bacterium]